MNRLGLTHDARMKSTAYVSLNTSDESERNVPPVLRTHLREIRFTNPCGNDLPEPETWYTPDLDFH